MKKTCTISGKEFEITSKDQEFYEKMWVGEPTLCPQERQRRRLVWQNMYHLYHRNCDGTGKKVISSFSPDKDYVLYDQTYWWGDDWDPLDYGIDFDFNTPFFEQFEKLMSVAPMPCLFTNFAQDVNSAYTNFAGYDKNCYLIFHADFNEDCYYATGLKNSKRCVDSLNVFGGENSYECVNCKDSYGLKYSMDCNNCSESWFLQNCDSCQHCFGSMNLKNAKYHLFNKSVWQEKYEAFMKDFESGKANIVQLAREKFAEINKKQIHKSIQWLRNQDCQGDHIFDCRDVSESFDVQESRDMKYCQRVYNGPNTDCYDIDQFGAKISKMYECANVWVDCHNVISSLYSYSLVNVSYGLFLFSCEDCLGCVGLRNQKYCIFNKQYSKEQYFELRDRIIAHMKTTWEWWEFFPSSLSPFGYNETIAQEYYPLEQSQASEQWYSWKQDDPEVSYYGADFKIPNDIADVDESILESILSCELCSKNYRITGPELEFYKSHTLPIPHKCSNCRHLDRVALRNSTQLFERSCDKCSKDMQTTFSPDRPETVYCESCYEKEVY